MHWQRFSPNPIVTPAMDVRRPGNAYGVGQPSVLHLDGWFYLMFTDTSGAAADAVGGGQFVLRSPDGTFAAGTQALTPTGFQPVDAAKARRSLSVADAFSADWMWVDALNAFAIAYEVDGKGTVISFWDKDFTKHPYQDVVLGGQWKEGPGLVRRIDGHAPDSADDPCGRVPIDLLRATGDNGAGPTAINRFGLDLVGVGGCRDLATLTGVAMPAPDRTMEMVVDGALVRIERRSVAAQVAVRVLDKPVPGVDAAPVVATIKAGAEVLHAADRPYAFLIDGMVWPVGAPAVAADSAHVTEVSDADWDSHSRGGDLSVFRGN